MTTPETQTTIYPETSESTEREATVADLALATAALELSAQKRLNYSPIPQISEWGPAHHRYDFVPQEPATPQGLS